MKKTYAVVALIALAAVGAAVHRSALGERAPSRDEIIEPDRLRHDLAELRKAILLRHPRFHDQAPSLELIRAFEDAAKALSRPMTRAEAFRIFALLNPRFEDAHTLLLPTFASEDTEDRLFPIGVNIGPDHEIMVDGEWVREGGGRLAANTIIRSINGETTASVLNRLVQYGHGETEGLRRHMLAVFFPEWLAAIKGWAGDFSLEVEHGGRRSTIRVTAKDGWKPATTQESREQPSLSELEDGVALLRLPTFDVDENPDAYDRAVDRAFADLRRSGARALIIDVRGNTGGQSDAGARVVRYLTDRPINQVSRARERLNESNRGFMGYKGRIGAMREMDLSDDGLIEPAPETERFRGDVVLLIDGMTYSAGILFATTLQDHGLADLLGEPTGGYANQTGNMEQVRLPHTGLTAYIPERIFVRPNGDARAAPVVPDVLVETATDGRDHALQAAVKHVRAKRVKRAEKAL